MPSPPSYGCCTRVNFVLKKHLLFQMNLSNSGLKNRSNKEYWLIFTVLKFPLGLQFSHNLTKFKIIKYISTIYIMTTTCTYLQQLTQVSDVAHGPLVMTLLLSPRTTKLWRGYRVCPVRMYVSTYVRTYVRSFVCSPALATSFIIQFRYNFTQVLDMTIPRTSSRFSVIGSRSRLQ